MKARCLVAALLVTAFSATSGLAYDQPAVNLGFTSFLDGGPPAGPGWYYTQYIQYFASDDFKDTGLPPGLDPELEAMIFLQQLIYQSDQEILFGGKWGLDLIVPYVYFDFDAGGSPLSENDGVGDVLIGPYLQWDPIMGDAGPVFMHRIELQMILPTGDYDDGSQINSGANAFSFNPYWAATYFFSPKYTASWRIHYLWTDKNDDPAPGPGGAPDDIQAGQAVHANFAAACAVSPKLHAGVNGYYLKQLEESEVDGDDVDGSKEEVLAIGPGAVYHFSQDDHLFFNAYYDVQTDARPEGYRLNLRWVHHF